LSDAANVTPLHDSESSPWPYPVGQGCKAFAGWGDPAAAKAAAAKEAPAQAAE
jgi:hypothetical protein